MSSAGEGTLDSHENRIGALEQGMAEIRTDLRNLGGVLAEIKTALNSSRPSFWVIAPIAISLMLILIGGVASFGAVREASAYERGRTDAIAAQLRLIEQRQWEQKR